MDQPPQDSAASPLWNALAEIGRMLESLRERLEQIEGGARPPAREAPGRAPQRHVGTPLAEPPETSLGGFQKIASIPSTGLDATEVFGLAVDRLVGLLLVERAALFLLDRDQDRLEARASRGFRRDDLTEFVFLPGEGLIGRAFREGRPLVYAAPIGDTPTDPFILRFPVRDAIALPIRAEGELCGVLYAGRQGRPSPFTAEEVQLLLFIADRIGTALAHRPLVDKIAGQVDRLRELVALSARSSLRYDIEEVLSSTCEAGCRLLRVRCAAIAIASQHGELEARGSHGFPEGALAGWRPSTSEGLAGELFATQQPVVCPDLLARPGPRDPVLEGLGLRALLLIPLRGRDGLVGGLCFGEGRVRDFSADDVAAAQLLAAVAGIAIENAHLFGELRRAYEELRATQEQLVQSEKVRALGEMAGGVAHEFNNILAIILGKTQLMLDRAVDPSLREDLSVIEEAAWRAADTVRRLQRFAVTRMEEGLVPVNLSGLVEDAVTLTRPRWKDEAEARGIRIEAVTDLDGAALVLGHPGDLREMITNLILNALDAMPNGGVLTLTTRKRQEVVELVVTDTGIGMSEDVRRRVFEPFFTTRSPQRAGLGLSVVHGIATRHKGTIAIESQEGRGTTLRISLPATQAVGGGSGTTRASGGDGGARSASLLVIEDEEQLRGMLVDILTGGGYSVEAASNGLDGLAQFQRRRFDVVVTDLSMPECSGLEVSRTVKKLHPGIPVVLLTGWGDLLDPSRIHDAGVDLMLVKPFRVERVLNVVADAVKLGRRPSP